MAELMGSPEVRVQKFLANSGLVGRREADRMIIEGLVLVNGIKALAGQKIDPSRDEVRIIDINGGKIGQVAEQKAPKVYWAFHKPDKTLVSRKSQGGYPTIFELPMLKKIKFSFSAVGRLDFRTEGLLILSNDGELIHRLMHPKFQVPKVYQVMVRKKLSQASENMIKKGIVLEDGPVAPSNLSYIGPETAINVKGHWYRLTVHEGRNHLVRRMFLSLDHTVIRLIRVAVGPVRLRSSLASGRYEQLTSDEIRSLSELVGINTNRR